MAVAGMPANSDEARQVGQHIADRRAARNARGPDVEGACLEFVPSWVSHGTPLCMSDLTCVTPTLISRPAIEASCPSFEINRSEKKAWTGVRNISNQIVSIQP